VREIVAVHDAPVVTVALHGLVDVAGEVVVTHHLVQRVLPLVRVARQRKVLVLEQDGVFHHRVSLEAGLKFIINFE